VLRKGDVLETGEAVGEMRAREVAEALQRYTTLLRVTRGPQAALLDEGTFYGHEYRVTTAANRMGIRLRGRAIGGERAGEMETEGAPLGAIQAPADGQPIILFVDQQTTGGYPKIANVITADLGSVGQLRPGDKVRFRLVSAAEARELLLEQEALVCGI
jgi:antagonist of KipI